MWGSSARRVDGPHLCCFAGSGAYHVLLVIGGRTPAWCEGRQITEVHVLPAFDRCSSAPTSLSRRVGTHRFRRVLELHQ